MQTSNESPRLSRILTPMGGVNVAFDHGLSGVPPGLEDAHARLREVLLGRPDGIIAAIGLARAARQDIVAAGAALVGALDGSIMDGDAVAGRARVGTADQFAAAGADCVKILFQLAWSRDRKATEVETVSAAVREAEAAGLPLMVEPVLFGPDQPKTDEAGERLVVDGCRIAVELGASVLKVPMIRPERLAQVVATSYCPVVVLGGVATDSEAFLRSLDGAMEAGVRGVAVGRNCWESGNPVPIVGAIRDVVTNRDLNSALRRIQGVPA